MSISKKKGGVNLRDVRRLRARLSEEESDLFTNDQSFLWKLVLENLEMQLSDTPIDSDSSGNNELIQISILNDWQEMKGKLTVIQENIRNLVKQLNCEFI